jgi:hypothetical protein
VREKESKNGAKSAADMESAEKINNGERQKRNIKGQTRASLWEAGIPVSWAVAGPEEGRTERISLPGSWHLQDG